MNGMGISESIPFTWTLSDDRRVLEFDFEFGTSQVGWDHPCTDENLRMALDSVPRLAQKKIAAGAGDGKYVAGQSNSYKRISTRIGTFYLSLHTGPPTWWFPKADLDLERDRIGLMVGWFRMAVSIHWRRRADDE